MPGYGRSVNLRSKSGQAVKRAKKRPLASAIAASGRKEVGARMHLLPPRIGP